ncbi:MAG: ABC transporter permease [Firmicutes bacterium]|nr:ABC transporter permease [Bacillota bacterium]
MLASGRGRIGYTASGLLKRYPMLIPLLCLIIVALLICPEFGTVINLKNILKQFVVVGIAALGATFVVLGAGIDLSVGPVISLCTVVAALTQGFKMPLIFLIVLFTGVVFGLLNGFAIARVKLPSFIGTFGMGSIAMGLSLGLSGGWPLFINRSDYSIMGDGEVLGIPIAFLIYFVLIVCTHFFLKHSVYAKHLYGLGTNEDALFTYGVNVKSVRQWSYVIAGFFAGVAAIIASSRSCTGDPSIGMNLSFDIIAATVIGGTRIEGGYGGIVESAIGTLIVAIINNVLNLMGVVYYWQIFTKGVILLAAILISRAALRASQPKEGFAEAV